MMSLARFGSSALEIADLVAVEDRPRLDGLQAERPVSVPETLHALRDSVLQAQVLGQSIHGGDRLGHEPRCPSSQAATLS